MHTTTDEAAPSADGGPDRPVLERRLESWSSHPGHPSKRRWRRPRPGPRAGLVLVVVAVLAAAALALPAGRSNDDALAAGEESGPTAGPPSNADTRRPADDGDSLEAAGGDPDPVGGRRPVGDPDGLSESGGDGGAIVPASRRPVADGDGGDTRADAGAAAVQGARGADGSVAGGRSSGDGAVGPTGGSATSSTVTKSVGAEVHPATTVLAASGTSVSTVGLPQPAPMVVGGPGTSTTSGAITSAAPGTTSGAITSAPVPSTSRPAAPGAGQLVWADEFDRLDTSVWALEHSTYGDGNGELQCYRPENVSVSGGRLVLRAVTETYTCPNGSTRRVTSGMVRSRGVTVSPGQSLEFRVKLTPADPTDQGGLWPAVWASGLDTGGWPRSGEIDFLEVMTAVDSRRSVFSVHYAKPDGSRGVTNRPVVGSAPFSDAWHTVRFDYGRDGALTWHLDGREVFAVSGIATAQGSPAPFDLPVREIKINLALGGRPGPLAPGAVGAAGATFEVDYIRIRQL